MFLSIVTTMYCSGPYVEEFYKRASAAAARITDQYEIVFINDGSPDDSLEIAVSIYERDPRVKVINLSRNFGHHKAALTGIAHARGDLVFFLDCDLEVAPEELGPMYSELLESDADTVYGVQRSRKGGLSERVTGALFYRFFNRLSFYPVPPNLAGVRLMSRSYVDALLLHREASVFLAGLCAITGFKQAPVFVEKGCKSRSTYNLSRKLDLATTAITSFSAKPLTGIFLLGAIIVVASVCAGIALLAVSLATGDGMGAGRLALLSVWFLGGLILSGLGLVGIYVGKILVETKRRPSTIIAGIYDRNENGEMSAIGEGAKPSSSAPSDPER